MDIEFPNLIIDEIPIEEYDWKNVEPEEDPDDELLKETPKDVVKILGFDPLEFEED